MSKDDSRVVARGRWIAVLVVLGIGYMLGVASRDALVQADVRRGQTEQQHFQSGAQRSEVLLREISTTLDKMDARLERMETLGKQFVKTSASRSHRETR